MDLSSETGAVVHRLALMDSYETDWPKPEPPAIVWTCPETDPGSTILWGVRIRSRLGGVRGIMDSRIQTSGLQDLGLDDEEGIGRGQVWQQGQE